MVHAYKSPKEAAVEYQTCRTCPLGKCTSRKKKFDTTYYRPLQMIQVDLYGSFFDIMNK